MLKCNVTIRGTVSRTATVQTKKGKEYACFAMKVVVPAKKGINKTVEMEVSLQGGAAEAFGLNIGTRVEAVGTMYLRKSDEDELRYVLHADTAKASSEADDIIDGTMEFIGTVGKDVEHRTSSKGDKYTTFSAFSTQKVGEAFVFIWVRLLHFSEEPPACLVPKAKIEAKGKLEMTAYNDRVSLCCKVESLKEHTPPKNDNEQ